MANATGVGIALLRCRSGTSNYNSIHTTHYQPHIELEVDYSTTGLRRSHNRQPDYAGRHSTFARRMSIPNNPCTALRCPPGLLCW
ncbi:MAG: hypothetical protein LBU42_10240, partial [Prevotellaceae bacterium]|nr:hypothetical protein [Prevotellaceae bacterium]